MDWKKDNVQPEQPAEETQELRHATPAQPEPQPRPSSREPAAVEPEPARLSSPSLEPEDQSSPSRAQPEPRARADFACEEGDLVPAQAGAKEPELDELDAEFGACEELDAEEGDHLPAQAEGAEGQAGRRSQSRRAPGEEGDLAPVRPQEGRRRSRSSRPTEPQAKESRKPRLKRQKSSSSSSKRTKRLVGLKIGASQLAAARVVNNGDPELVQVARERLEPASSSAASCAIRSCSPTRCKEFFRKHKLPRQGVRLGIANNRIGVRTFEIAGHRRPEAARERDPLPRPGGAADPDRGGRARLPGPRRADGRGGPDACARILLVVAYRELDRPLRRGLQEGRPPARRDRPRGLRAAARARRSAPEDGPPRTRRSSSSRSATTARPSPSRTAASASSRACSTGAASTLDVAIARVLDMPPSEAEPIKRALSLEPARTSRRASPRSRRIALARPFARQLQTFARELVSSLQFYQNQPGSLGIGEIMITGGTAHLPGLADELQRLIGVTRRGRRPAQSREARQEAARGRRAARLARGRHRTRDRGLTCAPSTSSRETTSRRGRARRRSGSCSSGRARGAARRGALGDVPLGQRQGEGQAGRAHDAPGRARARSRPGREPRQDADRARCRQARRA